MSLRRLFGEFCLFAVPVLALVGTCLSAGCRMPVEGGREMGVGWRPPGELYVYSKADPALNEATSTVELDLEHLSRFLTEWAKRQDTTEQNN